MGGFPMKHSAVSRERSREIHCRQRPHLPEVTWQNLPPPWSSVTNARGVNDLRGLPFRLLQLHEPFVLHKKFQTSEDTLIFLFLSLLPVRETKSFAYFLSCASRILIVRISFLR